MRSSQAWGFYHKVIHQVLFWHLLVDLCKEYVAVLSTGSAKSATQFAELPHHLILLMVFALVLLERRSQLPLTTAGRALPQVGVEGTSTSQHEPAGQAGFHFLLAGCIRSTFGQRCYMISLKRILSGVKPSRRTEIYVSLARTPQ